MVFEDTVRKHTSACGQRDCARRGPSRWIILVAFVFGSTGCSFVFVDSPPAKHRELSSFECSEGWGWPTVDVVLSLIWAGTVIAGSEDADSPSGRKRLLVFGSIYGGLAVLQGVSAIWGVSKVSKCRNAKRDLLARRGIPASVLQGREAGSTRITTRSGDVVEGRILGDILIAPIRTQYSGRNVMSLAIVEGADVRAIDSQGLSLWRYPVPDIRVWVVRTPMGRPLEPPDALMVVASGRAGDAAHLLVAARADELFRGRTVAGEVTFSNNDRTVQLAPALRVETARGVVSISVGDLVATAPAN